MKTTEILYGVSISVEPSLCSGCGLCITECAPQILVIDKTTKKIRVTEPKYCTACASCINACINEALKLITTKGENA